MNEYRYGLLTIQGAEKQGQSSAWKLNRDSEVTCDHLECFSLSSSLGDRDRDDENFWKSGESAKEIPIHELDVAQCLVYLCLSSTLQKSRT